MKVLDIKSFLIYLLTNWWLGVSKQEWKKEICIIQCTCDLTSTVPWFPVTSCRYNRLRGRPSKEWKKYCKPVPSLAHVTWPLRIIPSTCDLTSDLYFFVLVPCDLGSVKQTEGESPRKEVLEAYFWRELGALTFGSCFVHSCFVSPPWGS